MKITIVGVVLWTIGLLSCAPKDSGEKSEANPDTPHLVAGFQDLTVEEFKQKMTEPGVVILDVRTPEEISNGKIEGAVELDFRGADFDIQLDKFDKNKTFLVYCASGGRSEKTCQMMEEKGFISLFNLTGGYEAWSEE